MRDVVKGTKELTDEEIRFLDEALRKSGSEYTEDGFATFRAWGLVACVSTGEDGHWVMDVTSEGGMVNADWGLRIDKDTGKVETTWTATLEDEPDER